eukprot:758226-Alexandrium_andersonii.AAC.1
MRPLGKPGEQRHADARGFRRSSAVRSFKCVGVLTLRRNSSQNCSVVFKQQPISEVQAISDTCKL